MTEIRQGHNNTLLITPDIPSYGSHSYNQKAHCRARNSEITGLSYSLRDAIPIMNLLREITKTGLSVTTSTTTVHCRVLEDNLGAVEIANVAKKSTDHA
jgi:hypothetical protein